MYSHSKATPTRQLPDTAQQDHLNINASTEILSALIGSRTRDASNERFPPGHAQCEAAPGHRTVMELSLLKCRDRDSFFCHVAPRPLPSQHQEHAMELVILALSAGTLVLLATHLIDYASESTFRSTALLRMPDDEFPVHDAPLPFEDAANTTKPRNFLPAVYNPVAALNA
jgi:hypothetical protein